VLGKVLWIPVQRLEIRYIVAGAPEAPPYLSVRMEKLWPGLEPAAGSEIVPQAGGARTADRKPLFPGEFPDYPELPDIDRSHGSLLLE